VFLPHVARLLLWIGGWTAVGSVPDVRKAVVVGAPHTSNWDGFWALVYITAIGFEPRFFIKESMFWFPLGRVLRFFGAIPLDRANARSSVNAAIAAFDEHESFYFGLAPEGTRSRTAGWKSGFYRIAEGAGVPVVCGFFDYPKKRLGLGPMITLTGDRDADMAILRSFYTSVEGRFPEQTGPVVFVR
jgi:1-acyl-sn-glycerol-3-phosphate acyltransferase